jgi:hypothetical protein
VFPQLSLIKPQTLPAAEQLVGAHLQVLLTQTSVEEQTPQKTVELQLSLMYSQFFP